MADPTAAAAAAAAAAGAAGEKLTAKVDVERFESANDDFEKWVELFESAVKLATNTSGDRLKELCIAWLPHKIDEEARRLLDQAVKTNWSELKEELSELFVDPQERYKWQARQIKITWDGKESLHQLATRTTRMVDKYDKKLDQESKDREYFLRFMGAFKGPMRRFIFMGCPEGGRTIDAAKDLAMRYQLTMVDEEGSEDAEAFKAVAFEGGTLQPDRATGIETALAGITTSLENMAVTMRKLSEQASHTEQRLDRLEAAGGQAGQSWNQGYRGDWQNNDSSNFYGGNYERGVPKGFGRGGPHF